MFKALLIDKTDAGYGCTLAELPEERLPPGEVTVRVSHSTLNYKDALAITGRAPVVRQFPMVPGIDLAGTVEASDDPRLAPGDAVLLNGWGVGEVHWGGLAQRARVNGRGDGDRHCRLHRHAVCDGAAGALAGTGRNARQR